MSIAAGTYNERVVPGRSGSSGSVITVTCPSGEAIITGTAAGPTIMDVVNASYITFENIIFDCPVTQPDPASRWFYVTVGSGAHHITFDTCTVRRTGRTPRVEFAVRNRTSGVVIYGTAHHIVLDTCTIYGVTHGVNLAPDQGATDIHITGCHVYDTIQNCILVGHSDNALAGILIEGCTIEGSIYEDGVQWESDFEDPNVTAITPNRGTIVRGCVIRNNAENAIDLKGARNVLIEGNVVYGTISSDDGDYYGWNRNSTVAITHGANRVSSQVIMRNNIVYDNFSGVLADEQFKIYHNVIVANNRDYTGTDSAWEQYAYPNFAGVFQQFGSKTKIGIRNNIIGGHKYGGQLALRLSGGTFDIDNNIYYTGTSGAAYNTTWVTTGVYTHYAFTQWKAYLAGLSNVTGKDANSQWLTLSGVGFTNVPEKPSGAYTLYDFSVQATSPAYEAGLRLTTATNSGSSSTTLTVADATWFCDGYGCDYASGDTIMVGGTEATISAVDYDDGVTITLESAISWTSGDDVFWGDSITPHIGLANVAASAPPSDYIIAGFTVATTPGFGPLSFTFTDTSTAANEITSWTWDFGDGNTSSDEDPTHVFEEGTWTVTLTVSDGTISDSATSTITAGGILQNGDFSSGTTSWAFYTNGTATFSAASGAAVIDVTDGSSNTQLYQSGLGVTEDVEYELSFRASADVATSVVIQLFQHESPYAVLGLDASQAITTSPNTYLIRFTSPATEANARLRFGFNNITSREITIDDVSLVMYSGDVPVVSGGSCPAIAVGRAAANTSTGNQTISFDSTLENAPSAVLFVAARITADGYADDTSICIGAGDGTVQWYAASRHVDAGTHSDADEVCGNDAVIVLLDDTDTTPTMEATATWVSASTTGVTINWSTAPGSAYLVQVLAFDCDAACKIVTVHRTQNSGTNTALSFTPTGAIVVGGRIGGFASYSGTLFTASNVTVGLYDGTTQGCAMQGQANYADTSLSRAYVSNARVGVEVASGGTLTSSVEASFSTDNITITTRDGTPTSFYEVGVLAFDLGEYSTEVIIDTLPTSTGSDSVATSDNPGGVLALTSAVTTLNTVATNISAEVIGVGIANGSDQYSLGYVSADAVDTQNEKTAAAQALIHTLDPAGTDRVTATVEMGDGALDLTYTAVDTAAYTIYMVFGAAAISSTLLGESSIDGVWAVNAMGRVTHNGEAIIPGALSVSSAISPSIAGEATISATSTVSADAYSRHPMGGSGLISHFRTAAATKRYRP